MIVYELARFNMSYVYKPEFENNYHLYERIVKYSSFLVILFFGLLIFAWPSENNTPLKTSTETEIHERKAGLTPKLLVVNKPIYQGFDNAGHEYKITADIAQQNIASEIQMTNVRAEFYNSSGQKMILKSIDGTLDRNTDQIILTGNVTLIDADSSTLTTEKASIDFKNGVASSEVDVEVLKNNSTINAKGFIFNQKQNKLIFSGPVKTKINQ
jgi:LPS export ABC transporter protein LptC